MHARVPRQAMTERWRGREHGGWILCDRCQRPAPPGARGAAPPWCSLQHARDVCPRACFLTPCRVLLALRAPVGHSWSGRTAMGHACHTMLQDRFEPAGQGSGDVQQCMPPGPGVSRPLRARARAQGWRFAFYIVAATSGAAAVAILALGTDPTPHRPAAASGKVSRACSALLRQSKALALRMCVLDVYSHASFMQRAPHRDSGAEQTSVSIGDRRAAVRVRRAFGGAPRRARRTWRAACGSLCASGRSW